VADQHFDSLVISFRLRFNQRGPVWPPFVLRTLQGSVKGSPAIGQVRLAQVACFLYLLPRLVALWSQRINIMLGAGFVFDVLEAHGTLKATQVGSRFLETQR
jgi:hypothetical protein